MKVSSSVFVTIWIICSAGVYPLLQLWLEARPAWPLHYGAGVPQGCTSRDLHRERTWGGRACVNSCALFQIHIPGCLALFEGAFSRTLSHVERTLAESGSHMTGGLTGQMPKLCLLDLKRAIWFSPISKCSGILQCHTCQLRLHLVAKFLAQGSGASPVYKPRLHL